MRHDLRNEFRAMFPAWAVAVLLPAPAILTARNGSLGLMYFFVASMGLVADVFSRRDGAVLDSRGEPDRRSRPLAVAAIGLASAWTVMAAMCVTLPRPNGAVAATLAILSLVPSLCVVPWLLALVGNPYIAVFFSLTLVCCMKLLGCIVVVAVYGWDACERGYTAMPWTEPNLLVWSFLLFTATLSGIGFWVNGRLSQRETSIRCELVGAPTS